MFNQKAYILLSVTDMAVKEIKAKTTGKESYVLEAKGRLVPDGTFFTISKIIGKSFVENTEHWFSKKFIEFESIMAQFNDAKANNKPFYVNTSIQGKVEGKGKDAKVVVWDALTSADNGDNTYFQAGGFVNVVPFELDEETGETTFNFKSKDMKLSEMRPTSIEVTMIVANEDDTRLTLTSGDAYPKELSVMINDDQVGKAEIGQGYKFSLGFEKLAIEDSATEDDWDSEAKPSYAKTILKVKKVLGKVSGYNLENGYEEEDMLAGY